MLRSALRGATLRTPAYLLTAARISGGRGAARRSSSSTTRTPAADQGRYLSAWP